MEINNPFNFLKSKDIPRDALPAAGLIEAAVTQNFEGIAITNAEGLIVYVNPAWEKLTGWSSEEVVGKATPRVIRSGKQDKAFYENMWKALKNGEVFKMEIVNKRKDDSLYHVDEIVFPLKDQNNKIIGFTGFQRDITERKKAEESLISSTKELELSNKSLENMDKAMINILEDAKELEDELKVEKAGVEKKVEERTMELEEEKTKLTASISSLSIGFVMIDAKNNILMINQSARDIFCSSSTSPLVTAKECTLVHIEDELKGAIDLRSLVNKCITEKKILSIKDMAFENRYIKLLLTPIIEDSSVLGAVLLVENITEAKLVERSRDEFFSIASHELRTPLTAIKGNTSMMLDYFGEQLKDPQLKEMVDDIHESSMRLIGIVNDFLDTSKLELGKMEFKKEEVDMETLVDDVIKEYMTTGSMKKLYLRAQKPSSKIPFAIADKDRVKQIIINLIGNSLKFTEKGGIEITFEVEKNLVKVNISDTGKGISPESQNLLFRKFQQASESLFTRDAIHGTGLGLYISRMMAEGMGGEIRLESSVVNKGSVFSVVLPAKI